jgi:all-trans-retinol dehydrogenase (NAD+)
MIRLLGLVVACIALHLCHSSGLDFAKSLPLASAQSASLAGYLKWASALWALVELNAVLNRWAENGWIWRSDTSNWNWKNEVAVVTGGSNGIGACVAKKLVSHGIKVAVLDITPLSESFTLGAPSHDRTRYIAALTYSEERKLARYYPCDITSQEAIERSAGAIRADLGSPSILINNAGIGNGNTILDIPPERLRKLFEINLLSHWSTVKVFLPDMLARRKGHIMGVASLASFVSLAGAVDYSCTKSALMSFHEGLSQELKHRYKCPQIKTSIVHPGWTRSAITSHPALQAGLQRIGVKLLEAENVAEAMVKQVIAAKSGQLILGPGLAASIRALPIWIQELVRDSQASIVGGEGTTAPEVSA